ncbi:MAG: aminoacyl-tRNA hydrolase [Desulfobulbaceae bacterium]|nr:MAG: aminoacyl-tRNA hydrolase [Desulfobulbaceae bacterium]
MFQITNSISLHPNEIEFSQVRSSGPGGQHVNKVSSAVHLRFDVRASSLSEDLKNQLLHSRDRRLTEGGVIIIKAQSFRSFEKNKTDALNRLADMIKLASFRKKPRKATRPTKAAKKRRLESKKKQSRIKSLRAKVSKFD